MVFHEETRLTICFWMAQKRHDGAPAPGMAKLPYDFHGLYVNFPLQNLCTPTAKFFRIQ